MSDISEDIENGEIKQKDKTEEYRDKYKIPDDRFALGISNMDKQSAMNGIPKGSTIAVIYDPTGPGSKLLAQTSTLQDTHYITTIRAKESIQEEVYLSSGEFEEDRYYPENLEVREGYQSEDLDKLINSSLNQLEDSGKIIVNSMSEVLDKLSTGKGNQLIRKIWRETKENNAITYLSFFGGGQEDLSPAEERAVTLCDAVFIIRTSQTGSSVMHHLEIHRLNGRKQSEISLLERVKIGNQITTDTKRGV